MKKKTADSNGDFWHPRHPSNEQTRSKCWTETETFNKRATKRDWKSSHTVWSGVWSWSWWLCRCSEGRIYNVAFPRGRLNDLLQFVNSLLDWPTPPQRPTTRRSWTFGWQWVRGGSRLSTPSIWIASTSGSSGKHRPPWWGGRRPSWQTPPCQTQSFPGDEMNGGSQQSLWHTRR